MINRQQIPAAKMKVLFVIDTLQLGGAEQSLLENTVRFKQIRPVICHVYSGETLKTRFIENGMKVYSLNIKKKYGFLKAYKQLKIVVEEEKPDLMVAYLTRSEIVTRLVGRTKNIPTVGTFVTDLYCPTYNQHLSWKAKRLVSLFKLINKITSRICIGFIANSQTIKQANAKHLNIPLDKIKVINRGRSIYKFHHRNFKEKKSGPEIRFLNISRLFPVKGQKELIIGFAKFIEKYPSASLSIIGEGPFRTELTKIITENKIEDKVFLLGARSDVPLIISEYDCFVFPSLVEGFSGAIVEAMFAGIPILASNIPQNREAVTHLQTGYLFKKESVQGIEEALLWYKDNVSTAIELADHAYIYATEHFELDKIVNEFELYLNTLLPNKIEDSSPGSKTTIKRS